jgi:hypothetical protein
MSTTEQRGPGNGLRWHDELNRLHWAETRLLELIEDWRHTARELGEVMVPMADEDTRRQLDLRAAELNGAADELAHVLSESHAGGPEATGIGWAQWHLDELSAHLRGVKSELAAARQAGGQR